MSEKTGKFGYDRWRLAVIWTYLSQLVSCLYFSTNDPGRVNYTQPHLPTLQYFSNCIKFVREVEAGIQVNTNEVVYQSFGKHGSQIGSNAFNGDLGIFVASEQGVLFGRFSNDEAGNTTAAKTLLEAFSKNAIALENPQDSQIFVFAEAEYANPSALANSPVAQPFIDYVRNVLPASLPLFTVTYVLPQPGWFLQNGIIVTFNDSRDDFVDETELDKAIRGLVLVQNPGGGKAQSLVTFVNSYAPTFANPNLDNLHFHDLLSFTRINECCHPLRITYASHRFEWGPFEVYVTLQGYIDKA